MHFRYFWWFIHDSIKTTNILACAPGRSGHVAAGRKSHDLRLKAFPIWLSCHLAQSTFALPARGTKALISLSYSSSCLLHSQSFFPSSLDFLGRALSTDRTQRGLSSMPPGKAAFVSNHFKLPAAVVESYLDRKKLEFRQQGDKLVVMICPMCHDTKRQYSNYWKLSVWKDSGSFNCLRCGSKGSWYDLKTRLGDLPAQLESAAPATSGQADSEVKPVQVPSPAEAQQYVRNLETHPRAVELLAWLTGSDAEQGQRGLSLHVLNKYGVGLMEMDITDFRSEERLMHKKQLCVTFPWTTNQQPKHEGELPYKVLRVKARPMLLKHQQRLLPKGGGWGWFGWHTVPPEATAVVLTEGEFDAMAVHQATGLPAISLPNGASSLPVDLLPALERFNKIYLFMDDDAPGQAGAEQFARKLGLARCRRVQSRGGQLLGPKDANECLLQGVDILRLIEQAKHIPHDQVQTFADIRAEVLRLLVDPQGKQGLQMPSFPSLNHILKGHRRGELTVVTGPTGVGKTTVLSQMSLDLARQDRVTLWGSFEIPNSRLARTLLSQFSGVDFDRDVSTFHEWADRFEQLPFYFLKFFGSSPLDQVLDAMDYAVYVKDVQHIVLDNLQFMLSGQTKGYDKFEIQDQAISKFRNFATDHNVHITLVIHPRKEQDRSLLGVSSIFGSAKATQEADNVIIVQHGRMHLGPDDGEDEVAAAQDLRIIEIKKNRHDGQLGAFPVRYIRGSCRIMEVPEMHFSHSRQPRQGEANVWPNAEIFLTRSRQ
eukprot:g12676.t1